MNQLNILDEPVPDIGVPVLKPTPYKQIIPTLKSIALNATAKAKKRINEFSDWMMMNFPAVNLVPKQLVNVDLLEKALKGFAKSYNVEISDWDDPLKQLNNTKKAVADKIQLELNKMKGLKLNVTIQITFEKQAENKLITKQAFFNNKAIIVLTEKDLDNILQVSTNQIINRIGNWLSEGSGWTIKSVDNHYINIAQYKPLKGSSYIKLPEELRHPKKGLINIKNNDNECFRWSHLAKLHSDKVKTHCERISHYKKYVDTLNYDGIQFPVSIKQIPKIERQNNISVNVFEYENKTVFPLYVSQNAFETTLDLLFITRDKNQHYVWIKDFNRFI